MTADGLLYWSTPTRTVGLVVEDGQVVDGPPYARKCGYVGRDARELWREGAERGYRLEWLPERVRVLVTGSRDWTDALMIRRALLTVNAAHCPAPFVLVHGAARGADRIAASCADRLGWEVEPHPVSKQQWTRIGKAAGFYRNRRMVQRGAVVCLAFILPCTDFQCTRSEPHGTHGASGCADLARHVGIPVWEYDSELGRVA